MHNSSTNECKLIDWQLMSANHPITDFALFVFTSVNPEQNEKYLADFIADYYGHFSASCSEFEVKCPFQLDDFRSMIEDKGYLMALLFLMTTYNVLCSTNSMKKRFLWLFKKGLKFNVKYFS